jgi:acetolactate synthase-1/2/3 large subunit
MQALQKAAYLRTTATILAALDYEALARGFGVAYHEIRTTDQIEAGIQCALSQPGSVLTRVITDYGKRPIRWVQATKHQFTNGLSAEQKMHFMARLGGRAMRLKREND